MTNYEKIKSMDIDEILEFLITHHFEFRYCTACNEAGQKIDCDDCLKQWLESEVE